MPSRSARIMLSTASLTLLAFLTLHRDWTKVVPSLRSPSRSEGKSGSGHGHGPRPNRARRDGPRLNGTLVLQLAGEFGNHLGYLQKYYAMSRIAEEEYNLHLTLHLRKQVHKPKGVKDAAAENVKCLRSFRDMDFDECDWHLPERINGVATGRALGRACQDKIDRQSRALHELGLKNESVMNMSRALHVPDYDEDYFREALDSYVAMLQDESVLRALYRSGTNGTNVGWSADEPRPFLTSEGPQAQDVPTSPGLREYFAFDEGNPRCCAGAPVEDEHVFYHRSFGTEMPRRAMSLGFAELRPEAAAEMLAANLAPGTMVAISPGRAPRDRIEAYARAFRNKSFAVRAIEGQTAIQDFCFLARARAGLWGLEKSTYVSWAARLNGDLRVATLYRVNYPARNAQHDGEVVHGNVSVRLEGGDGAVRRPIYALSNDDVW